MNWVQYTFPAISAPHDERDEEELQSWKIELNNVLDQLHLISTICPAIKATLQSSVDALLTDVSQYCFDFYCGSEDTHLFESQDDLLFILDVYYLDCIVGSLKVFIEDFYSRFTPRKEQIKSNSAKPRHPEHRSSKKHPRSRKSRPNLPREAKEILTQWFAEHVLDPYPKLVDKELLSEKTGLPLKKIENWFINERSRKWHTYSNSGGY